MITKKGYPPNYARIKKALHPPPQANPSRYSASVVKETGRGTIRQHYQSPTGVAIDRGLA